MRILLRPLGVEIEAQPGAPLQDLLFPYGVEFPCGGRGTCRRCRVKVLEGAIPPSPDDCDPDYRLACRAQVTGDLTLEVAQWDAAILVDDTPFAFAPRPGLGAAVDLGTTTLVAQLVDLSTSRVLGVRTALNPQARFGADVMTRVQMALEPEGARTLRHTIRQAVGALLEGLPQPPGEVAICGNTVMHHLFCGVSATSLSHAPFEPRDLGPHQFAARELDWNFDARVRFLPCLGGFVGSDLLAGILATRIHEREELVMLVDLGTNGEIVVGNRERILCASTAAGPAFEGGRIGMGMRAATGAIAEVLRQNGGVRCRVLGGGRPRGICGSGLVDAAAAALDLGIMAGNGRLRAGCDPWLLSAPVALSQADIRELQLAKAAIAAGARLLLGRFGSPPARVYLAGAFGNYVNRASARRIGLLEFDPGMVEPAGNTALLGAKIALFQPDPEFGTIVSRIQHVPLAADPEFQEVFIDSLAFEG